MSAISNILITKNNDLVLTFKIFYFISLLITLCVLLSLVLANSIYYKDNITQTGKASISELNKTLYFDNSHSKKAFENEQDIDEIQIEKIKKTKLIPNITVSRLPNELKKTKSVENRKNLFIKIALPLIVKENEKLLLLNNKVKLIKSRLDWISRNEAVLIADLMKEYDSFSIDDLILKIDAIPVSLALSQAVIESGWGTSRFAMEGNALFGQYVWDNNNKGIIPNERESDAKYKIKSFDNLRASVESYMKNLNTNFHYNEFRIHRFVMRSNGLGLNGIDLADYLYNYSIESDYPSKIKNIIEINNFDDFENVSIERQITLDSDII